MPVLESAVATTSLLESEESSEEAALLAASAAGNVATCYAPMHNWAYPLHGGGVNTEALRQAIRDDFRHMSKYFKYVRTYYSQHFGIEVAPIAAEFGIKLYLGVFMTNEGWWRNEVDAAVNAVRKYPETVEVLFVGNENLANHEVRAGDILAKVSDLKKALGSDAGRVKFGTVQRISEYLDNRFNDQTYALADQLDVLGVNIYPFFTNSYDRSQPANLLDIMWNQMAERFPLSKMRLTETGFATDGGHNPVAPKVRPNLDDAIGYYKGLVSWSPRGAESLPKFWFMAFDRRSDDNSMGIELEKHFGFFTTDRSSKASDFPQNGVAPPPSSCKFEAGIDYVGNDIGSAASEKPESCCAICKQRAGCRAFSWNNYNSGTCWLKSGKSATTSNEAVTSAVVV
ncbi:TPA: hypothetical protein N0F65_006419 [Lagenidium giganteum]|uniref:glucan endo-1,3-beta-D-glucosidase n=1 Tax=Lagenidium giganteum TaxID=4803 RepID=A0AAV2Z793_9STRA|nr:TPA: hypothetical protein N0F65_006419 [Lagenidium giganteum]